MTDQNEKKYKQLALFGVITGEMVFTPCVLGGIAFWLSKGKSWQLTVTCIAAFLGLCIGIYRIFLLVKAQNKEDSNG